MSTNRTQSWALVMGVLALVTLSCNVTVSQDQIALAVTQTVGAEPRWPRRLSRLSPPKLLSKLPQPRRSRQQKPPRQRSGLQ